MSRPLSHGPRAVYLDSQHLLAASERARTDDSRPKEERDRICALLAEANTLIMKGMQRTARRGAESGT